MITDSPDPILDAARQGDPDALDTLLRQYQPRIYRFGMRMCRDEEDAKDVLQETLLAAARSLRGFRGSSSLSTWLYSIARGFCIKKRRRSKFAPQEEVPIAVRLHIDPCTRSDGPLKVVPKSHTHGIFTAEAASVARSAVGEVVCEAEQGAALVMRPLLLHSSSKSQGSGRRRVLHFLYGPRTLPHGLRWQTAV